MDEPPLYAIPIQRLDSRLQNIDVHCPRLFRTSMATATASMEEVGSDRKRSRCDELIRLMGCGISSGSRQPVSENVVQTNITYSQRKTRIIQEEVVDVCVNDPYDVVDTDWVNAPEDYEVIEETDEWIPGASAGGCRNDLELFATNPQFLLSLGPPEKHPDRNLHPYLVPEPAKEDALAVSVCLVQHGPGPSHHVAFFIYKADARNERLSAEYFLLVPPEGDTGAFVDWKQLRHDFNLYPGLYVIVAATFNPHLSGRFTLTVQAKPPFSFGQLLEINDV